MDRNEELELATSLMEQGRALASDCEFRPAKERMRQALEIRQRLLSDDQLTADVLYELGTIGLTVETVTSERAAARQQLLARARDIYRKSAGERSLLAAKALLAMGEVALQCEDKAFLPDGINSFQEALSIQVELLGPNHLDVAGTHMSLSYAHKLVGDEAGANQHYRSAIEIRLRLLWAISGEELESLADALREFACEEMRTSNGSFVSDIDFQVFHLRNFLESKTGLSFPGSTIWEAVFTPDSASLVQQRCIDAKTLWYVIMHAVDLHRSREYRYPDSGSIARKHKHFPLDMEATHCGIAEFLYHNYSRVILLPDDFRIGQLTREELSFYTACGMVLCRHDSKSYTSEIQWNPLFQLIDGFDYSRFGEAVEKRAEQIRRSRQESAAQA